MRLPILATALLLSPAIAIKMQSLSKAGPLDNGAAQLELVTKSGGEPMPIPAEVPSQASEGPALPAPEV